MCLLWLWGARSCVGKVSNVCVYCGCGYPGVGYAKQQMCGSAVVVGTQVPEKQLERRRRAVAALADHSRVVLDQLRDAEDELLAGGCYVVTGPSLLGRWIPKFGGAGTPLHVLADSGLQIVMPLTREPCYGNAGCCIGTRCG